MFAVELGKLLGKSVTKRRPQKLRHDEFFGTKISCRYSGGEFFVTNLMMSQRPQNLYDSFFEFFAQSTSPQDCWKKILLPRKAHFTGCGGNILAVDYKLFDNKILINSEDGDVPVDLDNIF
ncbi:hypothetical protein WJ62_22060 [Burkholderia diffusa]|nr:hypothetical protein WJ62_22060 [Burkholderia diffusa]